MQASRSIFEPYAWQQTHWLQMVKRFHSSRLAHAFLIHGAVGIGKLDFAQAYGRYVLCQDNVNGEACGRCRGCQLNQAGTHPDFHVIEPDSSGKVIRVDQIRALIEFSVKTAQQGGYRVVVVNPAERMNINAANALLKCLEEPGDKTLLMLVSHQISAILPTVRSRCQLMAFDKPEASIALSWLEPLCDDAEQAKGLLALSRGCPLGARVYLEKGLEKQIEQMQKDLGAITRGHAAPVDIAFGWQDFEQMLVLEWLASWVAEMANYASTHNDACINSVSIAKMLSYIAKKAGARKLLAFNAWLLQQRSRLAGQINLNRQLLMEMVLFRWLQLTMKP
ncbi:MAG: DNA polymerase III subunit delta' [Endozoicomonadaceae bacterium]|nr:DNA polymerase III subunit delta' [Endozoicomonadaceae bacterium]